MHLFVPGVTLISRCIAHEGGTIIRLFGRLLAAFATKEKHVSLTTTVSDMICSPFVALRGVSNRLATSPWRAKFLGFCKGHSETKNEVYNKCTTNRFVITILS